MNTAFGFLRQLRHRSTTMQRPAMRMKDRDEKHDIAVWGIPLSLAQYQWLFPDLHGLDAEDCARHWALRGRHELRHLERWPEMERLSQIQAQQLSDSPKLPPSEFIKLDIGTESHDSLDILFSHCNVPRGHFAFSHVSAAAVHSRLSVNVSANDWYQQGIPGISTSIAETVDFLRRIVDWLGCSYVRTIGSSMGAYAALLFGDLLGADEVVACDPEICLGDERMRSWMWNPSRVYDEQYRNITQSIRRLGRRALISVSAYDPMEAATAISLLELGVAPVFSKFFHGTIEHFQWNRLLGEPRRRAKDFIDETLTRSAIPEAALSQAADLYRDACLGVARAGAAQYGVARQEIEAIALYDAILHCAEGDLKESAFAMGQYLQFRRQIGAGVAEPLFDLQCRFGIVEREEADRIQAYLAGFILSPSGR